MGVAGTTIAQPPYLGPITAVDQTVCGMLVALGNMKRWPSFIEME